MLGNKQRGDSTKFEQENITKTVKETPCREFECLESHASVVAWVVFASIYCLSGWAWRAWMRKM